MLNLRKKKAEKDAHKAYVEQAKREGKTVLNETLDKNDAAKKRLNSDMNELDLPKFCKIERTDDIMNFYLVVSPIEGIYKDASISFSFAVDCNYPFQPPKIKCTKKLYHPNIDLEGNICLNILRDDWSPALSIQSIALGICFLFSNFNSNDPLNKDAADMLAANPAQFERNVRKALMGGVVGSERYDQCYPSNYSQGRGHYY